jgi:hypothetical protein
MDLRRVAVTDESGRQPLLKGGQLVYRVSPPVELTDHGANR